MNEFKTAEELVLITLKRIPHFLRRGFLEAISRGNCPEDIRPTLTPFSVEEISNAAKNFLRELDNDEREAG